MITEMSLSNFLLKNISVTENYKRLINRNLTNVKYLFQ